MIQERRASFAQQMQARRKKSGLTRGEIAQKIGVAAARIAYLERGDANWTPGMIRKYNEAVNAETPIPTPENSARVSTAAE